MTIALVALVVFLVIELSYQIGRTWILKEER